MDKSLQRQQAQQAALRARVTHQPVQRVGVVAEAPAKPTYQPKPQPVLRANGATTGNVADKPTVALKWNNDKVVRSDGANEGYVYADWRNF